MTSFYKILLNEVFKNSHQAAIEIHSIKPVTTMWDDITSERGQAYLDELVRGFWKLMIDAKAQVDRCDDAAKDG